MIRRQLQATGTTPSLSLPEKVDKMHETVEREMLTIVQKIKKEHEVMIMMNSIESIKFQTRTVALKIQKFMDETTSDIAKLEAEVSNVTGGHINRVRALGELMQEFNNLTEIYDHLERVLMTGSKDLCVVSTSYKRIYELFKLETSNKVLMTKVFNAVNNNVALLLSDHLSRLKIRFSECFTFSTKDDTVSLTVVPGAATTELLEAMRIIDDLDGYVDRLGRDVLNSFVRPFIANAESDIKSTSATTFVFSKTGGSKNRSRRDVLEKLEAFLLALSEALKGIGVDGTPFALILGSKMGPALITELEDHVLLNALPTERSKFEQHLALFDIADVFVDKLKAASLLPPSISNFESCRRRADAMFANERCCQVIARTKELVVNDSMNEYDFVGGDEVSLDPSVQELFRSMLASAGNERDQLPRLLVLQRCAVSKSVLKVADILRETIAEVLSTSVSASDVVVGRHLTTAHNVVKVFGVMSIAIHRKAISAIPHFAALYFNGCYYLAHVLSLLVIPVTRRIVKDYPALIDESKFEKDIAALRAKGVSVLEFSLTQMRRQLTTIVNSADLLTKIEPDAMEVAYGDVVNGLTMQLQQVRHVWENVMSKVLLLRSLGSLAVHALHLMTEVVIKLEDITEPGARVLQSQLGRFLSVCDELLRFDGASHVQVLAERDFYRLKEVVFVLNASLAEISDRWCDGKGLLAHWLSADDVKHLVRALFQNNERRSKLLAQIS